MVNYHALHQWKQARKRVEFNKNLENLFGSVSPRWLLINSPHTNLIENGVLTEYLPKPQVINPSAYGVLTTY